MSFKVTHIGDACMHAAQEADSLLRQPPQACSCAGCRAGALVTSKSYQSIGVFERLLSKKASRHKPWARPGGGS